MRLLSSVLSSWLRVLYGSVILSVVLCFLRLLVVPPVLLVSCVFLLSTLNFPNCDQRPGFFVFLLGLQKLFGDLVIPALQAKSFLSLLLLVPRP